MTDLVKKILLQVESAREKRIVNNSRDQLSGDDPVYIIVGSGRCGTTMLKTCLEAGKEMILPPEAADCFRNSVLEYSKLKKADWKTKVGKVFDIYQSSHNWKFWDLQLNASALYDVEESKKKLSTIIGFIYSAYLKKHYPTIKRWAIKDPYLVFDLTWVKYVFPNVKIIHMIRDGRDVTASWVKSANYYNSIELASKRWVLALKAFEKFKRANEDVNTLNLRYEDLVENPEVHLKKVCSFLNINYTGEMMMDKSDVTKDVSSLNHHQNARKAITVDHKEKWKKQLNESETQIMYSIIKKSLIRYRYL